MMKRKLLLVLLSFVLIMGLISGSSIFAASSATISWNTLKQPIDGFGISEAFHQSNNINNFPEPKRTEILDLLFSTTKGAGFSILRNIVGDGGTWGNATDGPNATIEPSEGVWWNWDAKNDDQIWLMNECKNIYGVTLFMSTVWSPPAWMKTNGSVTGGGNVKADKYQQFADYLAEYVNGYKSHYGIDIYAISMANEPNLSTSYSSCQWSSSQITDFVGNYVKPTFQAKNVPAKFIVNESSNFSESLVVDALNNANSSSRIDIVGTHCYGSSPTVLTTTKSKGKRLWETEVSNLNNNDATITDGLSWARKVHDFMTVSEGNAFFYWWGACYKTNNGEALIRMDMNAKTYSADKRLYTIGNFSRFVRPGWTRIDATANPASNVYLTAYKDSATGKFAIVVINNNSSTQDVTFTLSGFTPSSVTPYRTSASENLAQLAAISVSGGSFTATLGASSVTTFVGTATGGSTPTPTPVVTPTPVRTTTPVRTATPTTGGQTATPTPIRTVTPVVTATPAPTAGSVKVQFYNQSTAATSNQIYLNIQLINTGTSAIALSNVKIRYYYTIDGVKPQNFYCDYSPIGGGNVTGTFVTMPSAKTGADTYVEIGFSSGAGNLAAGANTTVQARVAKNDWTNYNHTNDYSFNSSATTYVDWTKVTGYVSGALQWGTEP
jgi:glucuronoarabinoxylan endo-1,4-beta-xylanase